MQVLVFTCSSSFTGNHNQIKSQLENQILQNLETEIVKGKEKDIYDKIGEYEPRAEIVSIDFTTDYERGILKPKVEVAPQLGY